MRPMRVFNTTGQPVTAATGLVPPYEAADVNPKDPTIAAAITAGDLIPEPPAARRTEKE